MTETMIETGFFELVYSLANEGAWPYIYIYIYIYIFREREREREIGRQIDRLYIERYRDL